MTLTRQQIREDAAELLGLFAGTTVDIVTGAVLTIDNLEHLIPNGERARDAYVTKDGEVYRRITTSLNSNNEVTLTSSLPGLDNGDTVGIYFLLPPTAMTTAINDEVSVLSHEVREPITLVANVNEYALPAWVTNRSQLLDVIFRKEESTKFREYKAPSFEVQTDDDVVTLRLIHVPLDLTDWSLIVRLRKYYDELTTESSTTTIPYPLASRLARVAIYKRLRKQYGSEFVKKIFGWEAVEAEREYQAMKQEHEPPIQVTSLYQDFEWDGPDFPLDYIKPSW